jgi:hypothetical protein
MRRRPFDRFQEISINFNRAGTNCRTLLESECFPSEEFEGPESLSPGCLTPGRRIVSEPEARDRRLERALPSDCAPDVLGHEAALAISDPNSPLLFTGIGMKTVLKASLFG